MAVTHPKALDIAVILAAIHVDDRGRLPGDDPAPVLDCGDSCLQNTFHHLVSLFNNRYAINAMRQCDEGVAMGRYADDHYYAGGAYFFSTLGAAEFCFKAAQHARLPTVRDQWFDRGQTFLRTVRRYAANDGTLAEQFRGDNGLADSCPDLAWSHAAFITALAARARAQNLLDTNQKCSAIT
jgi:glucoamylase